MTTFREEDHPRDGDGKFTDKRNSLLQVEKLVQIGNKAALRQNEIASIKFISKVNRDFYEYVDRIVSRTINPVKEIETQIVLSKYEYAVISQQAIKRLGHKQCIDGDFTNKSFVLYNHLGYGSIVPLAKISIEGNEEIIMKVQEVLRNEF